MVPPLRSAWAIKGTRAQVRLEKQGTKQVVFGAINLRSGHRVLIPRPRLTAVDFQFFLFQIHSEYRGWHVHMVLDQHKSHTAAESQIFASQLKINFLWLPKQCPQLNPMEHLWGKAKTTVCANRQYTSIDDETDRFINYLKSLSSSEALHQAGILSDNFWIK